MGKKGTVFRPVFRPKLRKRLRAPGISGPVMWIGRLLAPLYLRFALGFRGIGIRDPEKLAGAAGDFAAKKIRLIVAFRHPYGDEPQLLFHVFGNLIPRLSKKPGLKPFRGFHITLVHDYAVALWGGPLIRFILPRVGAVPVYHVRFEPVSLTAIRNLLKDGAYPAGIAPEGQISYHSETLPDIEAGTVRMGFWCAADIEKAGRPERVLILPLSVHCRYDVRDIGKAGAFLERTAVLCGMDEIKYTCTPESLLRRAEEVERTVLGMTEHYYTDSYGFSAHAGTLPDESEADGRQRRWNALLMAALGAAEHALGIVPGEEDPLHRIYRIRLEGWSRVSPENEPERLSPLRDALDRRRTGEAWLAMRHMEFADLMFYHDVRYAAGRDGEISFSRVIETVVNLGDLVNRLMGGSIASRKGVFRKTAVLVPGEFVDLTERLADYRKNPRQAVAGAVRDLEKQFTECIGRYLDGDEKQTGQSSRSGRETAASR